MSPKNTEKYDEQQTCDYLKVYPSMNTVVTGEE